ncbi:MAG: hypothetical protein JST91_05330 [Actinobacteria bacterium]|nr:hypothetical protein [Actinomycetota bacterium]
MLAALMVLAGCSSEDNAQQPSWVEDEVSFVADGLTIHGTYRHQADTTGPAALLLSESGPTDRNGDNAIVGPIGNMRQVAEALSDRGVASLRYDKVGTGKTGLGPYVQNSHEVGSAVYTTGAAAALRFLAEQPGTDASRISVYALGEGTVHALSLASGTVPDVPKVHALGLFQPLPGRYLDILTGRVRKDADASVSAGAKTREDADTVVAAWTAAVDQARTKGTVPAQLPEGLSALLSPANIKAVLDADAIDPLELAARIPAGTPVLLTCSDSDIQADCDAEQPLIAALKHTALTVVELKGVNHVLRDDKTDNVANYVSKDPLSSQLVSALDTFVGA